MLISVVLLLFILLGAVSAAESSNVTSTTDSDLIVDDEILSADNIEASQSEPTLKAGLNDALQSDSTVANQTSNDTATNSTAKTKVSTQIETYNPRYSKTATVFKIVLKDSNGNKLEKQSVSLKVNGKTYKSTTSSAGIATFSTPSLSKGTYSITVKYNGNSDYLKSSVSKKVKVVSSISASNMAVIYNDGQNYTARFYKNNGNLANSNVKITLNGKTYTVKTDSKGYAHVNIGLLPGTYTVKLYNPSSKETISKKITVNKVGIKLVGSDEYILPKTKFTYSVVLKNKNTNSPLKNEKIYFTYNKKTVTASTNVNGEAKITISALAKGTYTIKYQFKGNGIYKSMSVSKKLYVKDSTTVLKGSDLKMTYNDGSVFSAKATTTAGKALANKTVKFTLNGKTTNVVTDSNGIAKLNIGNLKPNTYTVKYTYSTAGAKDYNSQKSTITISKQTVSVTANDLNMKYKDGSVYQAVVKNKTGSVLNNIPVKFTLNGKTTTVNTDANGIAKLTVSENIGYYEIDTQVSTDYYTSSKVAKHILVNGTKFSASDVTIPSTSSSTFQVKVVDGKGNPVKTTIKFTLNNKDESVQTDANGIAKLTVSGLAKGDYVVTYTDGSTSGSSKITVVDKVTLKEIIAASQTVKKFIENEGELPNSVKIGSATYTTAEYVYLASKAIINLKSNNKGDIEVKQIDSPKSPKAASNLGNLYDYLAVAKSIVNTCNSKGIMPDSVSSKVGTIGYKGLLYATARVVAFYGDNSIMPNYVTIKTYTTGSSSSLNSKNTIKDLTAYLKASTNCQVGNSKIKSIVTSLTSGLTSDTAKARAIYNYVRDNIAYSFYYDTKYGAVGTLNAKKGNCVDEAHLLIAMYRTAGLAARYVHGTCVFSSGNTYGHVWTQVLIGDTWIVGDPTSSRNSFGNVVNWNNNNYNLKGYYASIAF